MAKTLLNGINEILKRAQVVAGDAAALTTLTDSARQHWIDVAQQSINESIIDLFTAGNQPLPNSQAESSISLVTSTRAYTLASDLVQLRWPIRDKTNSQYLFEYPGGYNALLDSDIEQDDTGLPIYGCIRPTDGKLYLDRTPTSAENGRVYTYQYDKSLLMTTASATMPFNDDVFTAMVPAWVELWRRTVRHEFDQQAYKNYMGAAGRMLIQQQQRSSWLPR